MTQYFTKKQNGYPCIYPGYIILQSGCHKGVDCTLYISVIEICFIVQIVASLLLFVEEEDTFWLMCTIVEDLVPTSYYSSTLIGVQVGNRQYLVTK